MIKSIQISIKKKLAGIALLSVELIIALALFICALIVFAVIAYRIFNLQNEQFDHLVFAWVSEYVSKPLTSFMQFITFFWQPSISDPGQPCSDYLFSFSEKTPMVFN